MNRLIIDCTPTFLRGGNSGIQRVIRNFVNHGPRVGKTLGIEVLAAAWTGARYAKVHQLSQKGAATSARHLPKTPLPLRMLVRSVAAPLLAAAAARNHPTLHLQPTDTLLYADSFWTLSPKKSHAYARQHGAKVAVLIYDLLALSHPEWFDPDMAKRFNKTVPYLLTGADACLTISQSTRSAVDQLLKKLNRTIPVASFPLGHELDQPKESPRPEVEALFSKTAPTYLCVATLEPRKNHTFLLDAFEPLWQKHSTLRLILIGRRGWRCDAIVNRITHHPQFAGRLIWLENATDPDLAFAYQNARAVIVPSLAEGLGLPIIEALAQQTPVLAANLPVLREAGGNFASYFSLDNPQELRGLIERLETQTDPRHSPGLEPLKHFQWPGWEESTRELLNATMHLIRKV